MKIKQLLFLFAFTSLSSGIFSQIVKIDQHKLKAGRENPDTAFIDYLNDIGNDYMLEESDSAVYYLDWSVRISGQVPYMKGELQARLNLARFYLTHGNFAESMKKYMETADIAKKAKENRALFLSYREISRIYRYIDDNKNSKDYLDKLWDMIRNKQVPDTGFYYVTMYFNEGQDKLYAGNYDSARLCNEKVVQYGRERNDSVFMVLGSGGLGQAYRFLGQPDSAFHYLRFAEKFAPGVQRYDVYRKSILGMADLYLKNGNTDSAGYYARRSYQLSEQYADLALQLDGADLLVTLYKTLGLYDSAFHYSEIGRHLSDSLFGTSSLNRLQSVAISNQLQELKTKQELEQAEQAYKTNLRTYLLLAGLLVLLIVLFFITRVSRQRAKSKKYVEKAYEELKATQSQLIQSEKMASLGELTAGIAHEIQNPLNFVNNFSEVSNELIDELNEELNKGEIDVAKAIGGDIKENLEKINHHGKRADAIVKGMLQHSRSSSGEKELTDINSLCDEYLRLAYHGLKAKKKSFNAKFETNFDESLPKINVVPQDIGRVVLNLINNAFYAVSERLRQTQPDSHYEPTVIVSTKKEIGKVIISVKDNGNGIPDSIKEKIFQPFFTTKPTGEGTGLGLSLSYDIIKAHGGDIKAESKEGEGTMFIIQLPIA